MNYPDEHIVISDNHSQPVGENWWQRFKTSRKLRLVLLVVLVAEVVWAGYTLTRPVSPVELELVANPQVVTAEFSASLELSGPAKVKVGDNVNVEIQISSPLQVNAADVVLSYDPTYLEASASAKVVTTNLFAEYPDNSIDNSKGQITLSGVAAVGSQGFMGSETLGTVTFKAKKNGKTEINLIFTKGALNDSNIIESKSGRDILESVEKYSLMIE